MKTIELFCRLDETRDLAGLLGGRAIEIYRSDGNFVSGFERVFAIATGVHDRWRL